MAGKMDRIIPKSALYIKLGRGGEYEKECLTTPGSIRVGWIEINNAICESGNWETVRQQELKIYNLNEQTATNQTNQLRNFYESGEDVLWITFHNDHLYWCFAKREIKVLKDGSKIRPTLQGWYDCDIHDKPLDVRRLSGSLLAIQGYRSTICNVREFEYLVRKINCETSPTEKRAIEARAILIQSLIEIIQCLNWKEFELLADLIFRQAGWQRLGVIGKTQKDIDLDLLSPIDNERYKVQVKSAAGLHEYQSFLNLASQNQEFARYYFIVHKPDINLVKEVKNPFVRLWFPGDIARLVVDYGLVDWLIAKAK